MKNYLAKHYKHYYVQTAEGQNYETTRAECIASGENPTAENPYKQRWFYDAENYSYIIRLPRNEQGKALYRLNAASAKREERYKVRKYACVLSGTGDCDNACASCQRKRYPRIIELDKPIINNGKTDGEPGYFDIAGAKDEYAEIDETDAFFNMIAQLTEKQQRLARLYYYEEKTTYEIAKVLGVSQQAVVQQLATVKKALKKYFENFSG